MKRKYEEIETEEYQPDVDKVEPMEIDNQEVQDEQEEYYTIENFIKEYIKDKRKKKLKKKKDAM